MRSVAKVVAIIVAAVVFPKTSAGQFRDYGTQCTVGSFRACASISIGWHAVTHPIYDIPATQLDIRLSNRQGSPGFEFDGWWSFNHLSISNFDWEADAADKARADNFLPHGTLEGNAGGWAIAALFVEGNSFVVENDPGVTYPLFGCNVDPEFLGPFFQAIGPSYTCGKGWLTWHVILPGTVAITNDTEIRLPFGIGTGSTHLGSAACVVGDTCVAAVPEPATLTLLGTGLASVALARRRRRKQSG